MTLRIGSHDIGYGRPTFIIAEGCSNIIRHLNSLEVFISTIAKTGATAAKIQLFKATHFPEPEQLSKKRVEFPRGKVKDFIHLCHKYNLLAGASVFDEDAVALLELHGADFIKLAVREYENINLWQRCLDSPLPLVASFDCRKHDIPWANNTVHLACVPEYPTVSPKIPDYGESLWGWSSHYVRGDRCLDSLLAVFRGACVVERHFALSETDYEAGWSSNPQELSQMVKDIREVERMR